MIFVETIEISDATIGETIVEEASEGEQALEAAGLKQESVGQGYHKVSDSTPRLVLKILELIFPTDLFQLHLNLV